MATIRAIPDNVDTEQVVVDTEYDEGFDDSASLDSDLTSIASNIRDYVFENGRRYHSRAIANRDYLLPNDEKEQDRLDMMHHVVTLLLNGRHHVLPVDSFHRVLDIGTGTGVWAIEYAENHPMSEVLGADISPIQPNYVPPNCFFDVYNVEEPWNYKKKFEFIHSRDMAQAVSDWPQFTRQIYDNLLPGGYVQLAEVWTKFQCDDNSIPPGGYIERYQTAYDQAAEKAGIRDKGIDLEGYLKDAGFQDVRVVIRKLPFGLWPKDKRKKLLGQWGYAGLDQGLRSYGMALLTRYLGMKVEEVEELCKGVMGELRRRDVHTYGSWWFVYGRKPAGAGEVAQ